MLKFALIALASVVVGLIVLSVLPQSERSIPDEAIVLQAAELRLYPEADPEAVWFFAVERADFLPGSRETLLHNIHQGNRSVGDTLDFTLRADHAVIDRQDNLRGERIFVHLLEANWDLDMQGRPGRQVLIDQRQGRFEVPLLYYTGAGIGESRDENVRMNFDLTNFEAGGPDTVGFNRFLDNPGQR